MPCHSQLVGALARERRFHRVSARLLSDLVDLTVLGATDPQVALQIPAAPLVLRPLAPDDELEVHRLDFADPARIHWMMRASYTFLRAAFAAPDVPPVPVPTGAGHAVQWVLVTGEGLSTDALLGAAARIGAAICAEHDEAVAVLWDDGRRGRLLRHGVPGGVPPAAGGWHPLSDAALDRADRLVDALDLPGRAGAPDHAGHVLVVAPTVAWPERLPRPHRVLVLTDRPPETVDADVARRDGGERPPEAGGPLPDALARRVLDVLREDAVLDVARDGHRGHRRRVRIPLFSAAVVCHLLPERPPPAPRWKPRRFLRHLGRPDVEPARGEPAATARPGRDDAWAEEDHAPIPDRTDAVDTRRRLDPRVRWRRDRCAVRAEGRKGLDADGAALRSARPPRPEVDASWARVGRAITHRRVGVALSGGGAYAFAFLQVLDRFDDDATRIPVDVLASASGGTILAAYLAYHQGRLGKELVDDLRENASWLDASIAASVASLDVLRAALDADMPGGRIELSEVRFAPVALYSPSVLTDGHARRGPYEAHAITRGTPGEAVRRSGSLPPLFAATPHPRGGTFLDGMLGGMVPTSALLGAGADFVVSCFLLPGPRPAAPDDVVDRALRRIPVVTRLADALYGFAFGLATASEEAAGAAHAYVVPPDSSFPFRDAFRFGHACAQVGGSRPGGDVGRHWAASVAEVHQRWRAFLGRP